MLFAFNIASCYLLKMDKTKEMKSISEIRLENLKSLIGEVEDRKTFTDLSSSQRLGIDYSYIGQLLNNSRGIGDKTARKLEEIGNKPTNWMDNTHEGIKEEKSDYTLNPNLKIKPAQTFKCEFYYWSDICRTLNSDITNRELRTMSINKNLTITNEIYGVEIDTDAFKSYPKGSHLLIEPAATPVKGDVIIISFDDDQKTIARYAPVGKDIYVELLERGMPGSKSLGMNSYTIHGVIIKAFKYL